MGLFTSKKFDPATDLNNLGGKVVIVTGGNNGVGYATVKALARRGAKVYMAARNESRATGAIASLENEGIAPGSVTWLKLDLLDLKGVKAAAETFLSKESRLDILVNNAAMLSDFSKEQYIEGIPEAMITNHLGPFTFTRALLPCLIRTAKEPGADVRIVNVASDAHTLVRDGTMFRTREDLNPNFSKAWWPNFARYCHTKLANVFFTTELQRRLAADSVPIIVIAVHPGFVLTFADRLPFPKFSYWVLSWFIASPDEGARNSLIAAASPIPRKELETYQACYLVPAGKVGKFSRQAQSPETAADLWQISEQVVNEFLDRTSD